jgi:hypothetical protein
MTSGTQQPMERRIPNVLYSNNFNLLRVASKVLPCAIVDYSEIPLFVDTECDDG